MVEAQPSFLIDERIEELEQDIFTLMDEKIREHYYWTKDQGYVIMNNTRTLAEENMKTCDRYLKDLQSTRASFSDLYNQHDSLAVLDQIVKLIQDEETNPDSFFVGEATDF